MVKKGKARIQAKWPIRPEIIPMSYIKRLGVFLRPLLPTPRPPPPPKKNPDSMLVHRRATTSIKFAGTYPFIHMGG